jgi:hypothetical protein
MRCIKRDVRRAIVRAFPDEHPLSAEKSEENTNEMIGCQELKNLSPHLQQAACE